MIFEKEENKKMAKQMIAGCGRYYQGRGVLNLFAEKIKEHKVHTPLIIAGYKGYSVVKEALADQLKTFTSYETMMFSGPCCYETSNEALQIIIEKKVDGVIGIGGGSCLDAAKYIAMCAGIPIITIPTCAATCAATSALSAMYDKEGHFVRNEYYFRPVDLVLVDTDILVNAPSRLLASGIADSFAKFCEYSCPKSNIFYQQKPIGVFAAYSLALAANDILLQNGINAYHSCQSGQVDEAFEDCVYAIIGLIGTISGIGLYSDQETAGRFAFAHALNEVLHMHFLSVANSWLHGEIVGVGILAQMYGNGNPQHLIQQLREKFQQLSLPTTLRELGFSAEERDFNLLINAMMKHGNLSDKEKLVASMHYVLV